MPGLPPNMMMPNMMAPHMMAQYGAMPPHMMGPMGHMPPPYGMPIPPHAMMGHPPPRPLFPAAAAAVNQPQIPPSQPKPTFPAYR